MHVVITGAGRGIGAALRDHYLGRGAEVTATRRAGGSAPGWIALDVTRPQDHAAMAAAMAGRPVDLLICNAGIYADKGQKLETGYPAALWAETFATNVTGVFLTVQALLPNLRAAGGKVAIIASQMGSTARAPGGSYIYRASKAAAVNLGRNLAADLGREGIAVGVYHPGWVRTDMGGPGADIDAAEAVAGLAARFDALAPQTSGIFEDWAGRVLPF